MLTANGTTYHNVTDYPPEYRQKYPDIKGPLKRSLRKTCNRNLILNRLPIIKWLPHYKLPFLFQDMVAGITVGLTAIPQGIAYAVIAGLEPQYGLYSGFMGCFVYFILGSCKDITIGPTAIMALMTQKYVKDSPDYAVLIAFLAGLIILLLGILNLGFLVQFISQPVTIGFTSAAAITIGSSQIKALLGLPGTANDFLDAWENVFMYLGHIKLWDSVLGISTVIFLLVLQKLNDFRGPGACIRRYISLSRNALAVFIGTILAFFLTKDGVAPFALTGKVASGFPPAGLPPFSTVVNNQTVEFNEMISGLGSSLIAIPLIAILESIAIAKAFSKGKTIDATQEMIALGMCNILGSFFSSMPTTGSFTRTAVNNASGVRTTLGGIFTGLLILLSLGLLTETFQYIPKATLAAVIVSAMIFMVDYKGIAAVWQARRIDIIPLIGAMVACLLLGLEFGILIGIAINLVFVMYTTARPQIRFEIDKIGNRSVLIVEPDQSLVFSAAEHFKYKILKHGLDENNAVSVVIIKGDYVHLIDVTVAKCLLSLVDDLKLQGRTIVFWNWKEQPTGVAWRTSLKLGELFRNTETIEKLVETTKIDENV